MTTPKIYSAIAAAMEDIGAIRKSKLNAQQRFQYRGIDDVMNALYPIFSKHGLFLAPEVLEHTREERTTKSGGNLIYSILKIRYTMYASDGSYVSATVIGEGMDSADKSSNKAMSVGMKYAMFQLFCIPTEEMKEIDDKMEDPDAESFPESTHKNHKLICVRCKNPINGIVSSKGSMIGADVAMYTKEKSNELLCWGCYKAKIRSYERVDAYAHEDAGDRI